MAMNEVNPLSFIRRVIPDTAAKTNAETFKQKAALGLQNNKDNANMARVLAQISSANRGQNLSAGVAPNASPTDIATALAADRTSKNFGRNATGSEALANIGAFPGVIKGRTGSQIVDPEALKRIGVPLGIQKSATQGSAAAKLVNKAGKKSKVEGSRLGGPDGPRVGAIVKTTDEISDETTATQKGGKADPRVEEIMARATKQFGKKPDNVFLDGKGGFIVSIGGQNYPGTF